MKLSDIPINSTARLIEYQPITKIEQVGYRQRLLAMGLTPGVSFKLSRVAPLGDPIVLEIRGYFLSLRKEEAALLEVEVLR